MSESAATPAPGKKTSSSRRGFFSVSASLAIVSTVVAGAYATLFAMAGRFLYPAGGRKAAWQFVTTIDQLRAGESLSYTAPTGAKVVVARQSDGDTADSFIALSSICPHLGCAVHWEPQNDRFFCPCHNGAFDASGNATEGPPAASKQMLERFPLMVDRGRLFIEVPLDRVDGSSSEVG